MDFEEWYKSIGGDDQDDHAFECARGIKDVSKQTWDACKNEVLKLLKDSLENDNMDRLEEEIEKL